MTHLKLFLQHHQAKLAFCCAHEQEKQECIVFAGELATRWLQTEIGMVGCATIICSVAIICLGQTIGVQVVLGWNVDTSCAADRSSSCRRWHIMRGAQCAGKVRCIREISWQHAQRIGWETQGNTHQACVAADPDLHVAARKKDCQYQAIRPPSTWALCNTVWTSPSSVHHSFVWWRCAEHHRILASDVQSSRISEPSCEGQERPSDQMRANFHSWRWREHLWCRAILGKVCGCVFVVIDAE